MSGGSMDYLFRRVEEASFKKTTPERRAFAKHLQDVARALRAIEWNDSGDGAAGEGDLIMACISHSDVLAEATREARIVRDELSALLGDRHEQTITTYGR